MDYELIKIVTELIEEEWLLRSFPNPDTRGGQSQVHFKIIEGKPVFSRSAFNDTQFQPSVDRWEKLNNPAQAKFNENDVVIKLSTTDVINLTNKVFSSQPIERRHYVLDNATIERPAHAKIMSEPLITQKPRSEEKYWKAFRELLALAATRYGWVIPPT